MNFSFTLTANEVVIRQRRRPRRFLGHPLVDRIGNALMVAFSVVLVAGMMSVTPRWAVLIGLIVAGVTLYNSYKSTIHVPKYRISFGRAEEPMEVVVTDHGISTTRGNETTRQRWGALHKFHVVDDGIVIEFLDTTVRWVPDRAFANPAERAAFIAFINSHSPSTIAAKLRVIEDTRPVVSLVSGNWRWHIEPTENERAILRLDDPADERNNIIAEIDDEWVEWTPERLDAAIGVPTRRDFVDYENVAWRIAHTAANLAEASPIHFPHWLPKPASLMWVRADAEMESPAPSLPWHGLGHVTNDVLREWLTHERAKRDALTRAG